MKYFITIFITHLGNCIGARLGKLQSKIGLVHMLRHYNFEYADKKLQQKEIEIHPRSFVLAPKETIYIKATKR